MEMQDIEAAVRDRMHTAIVDPYPFPHLVVTDCFPAPYYELLIAQWPAEDEFFELQKNTAFGIYFQPFESQRSSFLQSGRGLMSAEFVRSHDFWIEFRRIIENAIVPALAEKFSRAAKSFMRRRFLRRRPALTRSNLEITSDLLFVRRDNHFLPAHVDDLRSLIQVLIYLPPDDNHPHLGTQLYEQVGPGNIKAPAQLDDARQAQAAQLLGIEVREVKRIPYQRNTLVANLNHPRSWHGQTLSEPYDRRTYQGFVGVRSDLLDVFFDPESAARLIARI
jgi:hypothetical protein